MDQRALFKKLQTYLPKHLGERLAADISPDDARAVLDYTIWLQDALSTYLPRYLLKLITDTPTPGQVESGFRDGTVVLADVSGFTAMSERLSALGKEGAEEITLVVNDYYNAMLEISAQYGGDLLKFGGDSLLILFEEQSGPRRALAAAQAMQRAMDCFARVQTSQGVFPLQMSVGIGHGPVFLAHLGTAEKMEYAVMGPALSNVARAEGKASAGQTIVDRATRDAMLDAATFAPVGDDFWRLETLSWARYPLKCFVQKKPLPFRPDDGSTDWLDQMLARASAIEALRPFVPDELFNHLISDPQQPTLPGSHRPVTVMFANFYGIDEIINALGPAHKAVITAILNLHFGTMSRILTRYGGLINKVDTFAVGHRIMALFGALRANEDDPRRAVGAALEMNQALGEVNRRTRELLAAVPGLDVDFGAAPLKQRIGLNSGFVFAGNVGTATRREYSVMGDEVNLTARLMEAAQHGEVLISQSTARHVGDHFVLSEKRPVRVKGKTGLVRNFVVTGLRERPLHWASVTSGPLVGREKELKIGQTAADRALAGHGGLLVISGVSGMGKTRLAEEIALYGRSAGMDLLAGTCLSYGQTMPYHPWADILRACFDIQPDDDARTRVETVQRELGALGETIWAPIFGDVLGLDVPGNDLLDLLDARLRRQRLLDLTLKLLQTRAQSRPLMLVIKDAHWADPASTDLINYVARNVVEHPILFVISCRPDKGLPDLLAHAHATALPLDDLPDDACLEIVRGMLGPLTLPDALRDLILSKGAGNPFFVEEVVRALIDAGALRQNSSGGWQVNHNMQTVALPDTIHGVIISRIDRLPQAERQILQVASVVGRVFSYHTLENIYPYGDLGGALKGRLDYLSKLSLLELQSSEDQTYRFKHLTTWDVVYESQAFEQRRNMHRRIARFIESESAETLAEQTDLLAYHCWEGHDWVKATEYNLLTARRAQQEFANDMAVAAYWRALEAAAKAPIDTTGVRLLAYESLGELLTLLGRYEQAMKNYAAARGMIGDKAPSGEQRCHLADLCRKTAAVYERRSEYDEAFKWLEKGLSYLDERAPSIEVVRIYLLGAGICRRQGKNDEAIDWCMKSLGAALGIEAHEGRQAVAQAYYNLGGIYEHRGDLQKAVMFCRESIVIYQQIDDIVGLSQAYINLSNAYSSQGDWEQASDALRKSLAIKQKIGDIFGQGMIANNLANIHLDRGEWDQAASLFEQSHAIWKQVGAAWGEAIILSNLAQVRIYQEDWSEARACLSRSQTLFAEIGSEDFLPELERRWGEFHLARVVRQVGQAGELDQALAHVQRSLELAIAQEARLELGMSYRLLGQVHLARGEVAPARSALHQSLQILDDLGIPYQLAKTLLCLVQLATKNGSVVKARSQLAQAIETFASLGAQADLSAALALQKQLPPL
jgi:class 3 adenylate cyclase/predicted ATPase